MYVSASMTARKGIDAFSGLKLHYETTRKVCQSNFAGSGKYHSACFSFLPHGDIEAFCGYETPP